MSRILVIGDAILDIFTRYEQTKFCPDAPSVPVLVRNEVDVRPGGAANVARNVKALSPGTTVDLICAYDDRLTVDLVAFRTYSENVLEMPSKERVLSNDKFIQRMDRGIVPGRVDLNLSHRVRSYVESLSPDLIIYSDYGLGTVGALTLSVLLEHRDRLIVDTKEPDLRLFEGAKVIKLNRDEWKRVQMSDAIPESHCKNLIVTDGGGGSELIMRSEVGSVSVTHSLRVRPFPAEVVDVCGAGDTYVAGLAASLLKVDDVQTAMLFASAAASTVVSQKRTAVADLGKTLELLGREE